MLETLDNFIKQKDFLICVDSDGTAIDAMNIKHKKCFGPCLVKEYDLQQWENQVLDLWNYINLYSPTRGTNRFLALYDALCAINEKYTEIEGLEDIKNWLDNAKSLSNADLHDTALKSGSNALMKALSWSQAVNTATVLLTYDDKRPFSGVTATLRQTAKICDVAVVTSAGYALIREEWEYHNLLESVSVIASQENGTKAQCIGELLKKGYKKTNVIMLGDAPSDMKAALSNGVYFYPICVDGETKSWRNFSKTYLNKFVGGTFGEVQQKLIDEYNSYFKK